MKSYVNLTVDVCINKTVVEAVSFKELRKQLTNNDLIKILKLLGLDIVKTKYLKDFIKDLKD